MFDNWFFEEYVWEVKRSDRVCVVKFGGIVCFDIVDGKLKVFYENYEFVWVIFYDIFIIGYGCNIVNILRFWSVELFENVFDFVLFLRGDYIKVVEYRYMV